MGGGTMKILMVMAHPDDELIFGWPIIQPEKRRLNAAQYGLNTVSLLTLSSNAAKYGQGPLDALRECCSLNGVELLESFRSDSNFYRLATRYADTMLTTIAKMFYTEIKAAIDSVQPDFVFTHNPMGEYGHGDHRFLFNLVSLFSVPLLLTDICFANECHLSSKEVPDIYSKYLFRTCREPCTLDREWYGRMRAVYERHRAWSWSGHEPPERCFLYEFK
jgi:hypothetical protein